MRKLWPCLFGLRCAGQCMDGVFTCSACGWRDVYGSRKAFPELYPQPEYKVISTDSLREVERQVEAHMTLGWAPVGSVAHTTWTEKESSGTHWVDRRKHSYAQSMVRGGKR